MLGLSILIAFSFQGSRGLYKTTEGRYAEVALEMMENGNYLEPTLEYKRHWTKPPLTYWAMVAGMKLCGQNEWGIRIGNSVAFVLTIVLVMSIGTVLWNRPTGIWCGLIYATSVAPAIAMMTTNTDTMLTLWEVAAVYGYVRALTAANPNQTGRWVAVMWLFFGLGFLTKGPPSLLPLTFILSWHYYRKLRFNLFTLPGLALFIIVGLGWYIYVTWRHPSLLHYFLGEEIFARVATDNFGRNPEWYKPFTFYLPFLTFGAGPWLFFLLKTIHRRQLYRWKKIRTYLGDGTWGGFLLLWLLFPLIILSVVKSRLPLYVLPLYAPVALIIGHGIGAEKALHVKKIMVLAIITGSMIIGVKGIAARVVHKNNMHQLYTLCHQWSDEKARIVTYQQKKLFGLRFYLKDKITSLTNMMEPGYDATLDEFIRKIKKQQNPRPVIFIARLQYEAELAAKLDKAGLTIVDRAKSEGNHWLLLLTRLSG